MRRRASGDRYGQTHYTGRSSHVVVNLFYTHNRTHSHLKTASPRLLQYSIIFLYYSYSIYLRNICIQKLIQFYIGFLAISPVVSPTALEILHRDTNKYKYYKNNRSRVNFFRLIFPRGTSSGSPS